MKTIFRTNKKNGNFTCISNSILQSETLSPDEIGVLVRLLSLPENFVINKTSIWKTMNIGREHFHKVWNKLADAGYIQTTKTIDTKLKHFEYTHTVHEIPVNKEPVHQIPVHQEPVNGKLVSLIIDNKKETEKKPEEKENGEFWPSTGPKKENNVDTPNFFQFDIKSEELPAVENTSTISSPVSLNDIKKQKVLNLDFLKEVKDVLTFMDYEELIEHLNGEFQNFFPLSPFEKYQLGVIVNGK